MDPARNVSNESATRKSKRDSLQAERMQLFEGESQANGNRNVMLPDQTTDAAEARKKSTNKMRNHLDSIGFP
ncbi:hypothetical protein G7054_g13827 [Neopestalotiopsis clavispora]|nr:hypothetical protein G7054_g13827 [Neopestalotiopsis clavispora]